MIATKSVQLGEFNFTSSYGISCFSTQKNNHRLLTFWKKTLNFCVPISCALWIEDHLTVEEIWNKWIIDLQPNATKEFTRSKEVLSANEKKKKIIIQSHYNLYHRYLLWSLSKSYRDWKRLPFPSNPFEYLLITKQSLNLWFFDHHKPTPLTRMSCDTIATLLLTKWAIRPTEGCHWMKVYWWLAERWDWYDNHVFVL